MQTEKIESNLKKLKQCKSIWLKERIKVFEEQPQKYTPNCVVVSEEKKETVFFKKTIEEAIDAAILLKLLVKMQDTKAFVFWVNDKNTICYFKSALVDL